MRVLLIVIVQVAIAVFLTASVMPLVLVNVPAAQVQPRLGVGIMAGICAVIFAAIAFIWPWRRK
jgi:hypothetical protein